MLIAGLNWIVALFCSYPGESGLLATALDGALTAISTAAFLGAHIMPAVFGILAGIQILRGFLEGDLLRAKARATRWAWACLVVSILLMGLCIAFTDANGSAPLRILSHSCNAGLRTAIIGVFVASLGLLIMVGASVASGGHGYTARSEVVAS